MSVSGADAVLNKIILKVSNKLPTVYKHARSSGTLRQMRMPNVVLSAILLQFSDSVVVSMSALARPYPRRP